MTDRRRHRGPHPADGELFAEDTVPALRSAVAELSWLLTHGYARPSALEIVGNRHNLTARQRTAVSRSSCSDRAREDRHARMLDVDDIAGTTLRIDGFNLLTTIEAALAGGVLLVGRDGCLRDMASMHGSYRRVEETIPAIEAIGQFIETLAPEGVVWWFDAPVSNSGRVTELVRRTAETRGWPWEAEVVHDPDRLLATTDDVAVTADGGILDDCGRWLNLARLVVRRSGVDAWTLDLEATA